MDPAYVQHCLANELPAMRLAVLAGFSRSRVATERSRDVSFARTRANMRWNAMVEDLIEVFTGASLMTAKRKGNTVNLLCFRGGVPLLFRLKKMDNRMRTANVRTAAVLAFEEQTTQYVLPDEAMQPAVNLVVGYMVNSVETAIERIVIAMPNGRNSYQWVFDIEGGEGFAEGGTPVVPVAPIKPTPMNPATRIVTKPEADTGKMKSHEQ